MTLIRTLPELSAKISGAIAGKVKPLLDGKQDKLAVTGAASKGVYVSAAGVVSPMTYELNANVPANFAPATAAPLMDGTAAVGTSAKYAREDHRHPADTSRASTADLTALVDYIKSMDVYRVASGNPATFSDAKAANVRELSVAITPTQSGSGDPSPSNVRPISGVSSVNVTRTDAPSQIIEITPTQSGSGDPSPANIRPIAPGLSFARDDNSTLTVYDGTLDVTTGELTVNVGMVEAQTLTVKKLSNSVGYENYFTLDSEGVQPPSSHTAPAFCSHYAFTSETNWARLTNFHFMIRPDTERPAGVSLRIGVRDSHYTTVEDFTAYLNAQKSANTPVIIVYPLATPATYQLTPTEIERALAALRYAGKTVTVTLTDGANPLTVYGGTLNVATGTLTVTHNILTFVDGTGWRVATADNGELFLECPFSSNNDNSDTMARSGLEVKSSHYAPAVTLPGGNRYGVSGYRRYAYFFTGDESPNLESFSAWLVEQSAAGTPFQIWYKRHQPATYQLTPAQLATLPGYNAVFSNAGPVDVTYKADTSIVWGGG